MKRLVYMLAAAATVLALADESRLMPCPDCGKAVSKRALMCPGCGLKGEIIAEEAAKLAKADSDVAPTQTWTRIPPMKLKRDAAKILEERRQK